MKKFVLNKLIPLIDWRIKEIGRQTILQPNYQCEGTVENFYNVGFGVGTNIIVPKGATLTLGKGVYIGRNVEIGPSGSITIDDYTSIQDRCTILGDVKIGRYCVFASNIHISSGRHYFDLKPYINIKDQDLSIFEIQELFAKHSEEVIIEDDCWIGTNVFLKSGIKVGKGSIIGANSVVTKDVFPYTVVAGIPARFIRNRLDFIPSFSIRYDNETTFPYFYEGFLISKSERDLYSSEHGLAVRPRFKIAISFQEGDILTITCKKRSKGLRYIMLNSQKHPLTNLYAKYPFQMKTSGDFLEFIILSDTEAQNERFPADVFVSECLVKKNE